MIIELFLQNYGKYILVIVLYQFAQFLIKYLFKQLNEQPTKTKAKIAVAFSGIIIGFLFLDIPDILFPNLTPWVIRIMGITVLGGSFWYVAKK